MYLLDTNVLVDFLRGKSQYALRMLRASNASVFRIPSVVKAELLLGVEKSADPGPNRLKVELLLLPFEVLPFDDECALHYARIRAHLEGKGMSHGATLVTNNVGEFQRIPGLSVEQWAEVPF